MTDDVDLTWDFVLTPVRFEDNLHSPYVRGTMVTLWAHSSDDKEDLRVRGHAVGEGTAGLRLLDPRGHEVGRGVAEVRVPDAIELDAHGSLILRRDDEAKVAEVRMLAGGEATYLVRYFREGRELHGNGVLAGAGPADVTLQPRTTFLFENREWLTVGAPAAETGMLELAADQVKVATVPLVVVPESAIADVVVLTEGDWLAALAQAYDGNGERIFGVDYMWNVAGAMQTADGDLYRYQFKSGRFEMVRAQRGVHSDSAMIQSEGGFVDSTNHVGCTAGGGGGAGGGGWLIAGLAALGLVRVRVRVRRRRAG
ncbi:MAG: hypothetical protein E6J91_25150 [Deltaproteobacteria bacterium]|nr:MAG: hypothetical protein E6J91_25150 [Deltaproteobacteria bacterium]